MIRGGDPPNPPLLGGPIPPDPPCQTPLGRTCMHRIEAGRLIPGHGGPVSDGVVVLDGSSIGYAGPAGQAPPTPGAVVTRVTAVMPGMWECHGHLLGTRTFDLGQLPLEPEALRAARCTRDLRAALDAGITSVRDVGGLGVYLDVQREVDLVVQRDAVVADARDLRLRLPGAVDRA